MELVDREVAGKQKELMVGTVGGGGAQGQGGAVVKQSSTTDHFSSRLDLAVRKRRSRVGQSEKIKYISVINLNIVYI